MPTEMVLARPDPTMTLPALDAMLSEAQKYVASGLLPPNIKTAAAALLIMKCGRELGVPATYALRNIHVWSGRPTCSAELMLALIKRDHGSGAIRVKSSTPTECVIEYREDGWDGVSTYSFTQAMAKTAGLADKPTWKQYPDALLRARAISAVARFAFPGSIAGLYLPEELGAEVTVDAEGSVVVNGHAATEAQDEGRTFGARSDQPARVVPTDDCADCKQPIQDATFREGVIPWAEIARRTTAKYGNALCYPCAMKREEASDPPQPAEAADPTVFDPTPLDALVSDVNDILTKADKTWPDLEATLGSGFPQFVARYGITGLQVPHFVAWAQDWAVDPLAARLATCTRCGQTDRLTVLRREKAVCAPGLGCGEAPA